MQCEFSSSDWFDSGFIGGVLGNNSDLARITDLRGSSSPIDNGDWADRCSIGLSRFSLPSFLFLFPLNLSDRWSLLRTSLNFIPTLRRLDHGQSHQHTHLEKDLALYLRHFCRRHPVQYFSTEMSTTQVPSFLHALSVFLSGTRLDWSWMRIFLLKNMHIWFHWNLILPEESPALVAGDRPIVETDLGKDPAHSALTLVPVTRHLDCFSKDSETLLINLNCCWTKSSLMGSWQPTKISGSTEQGYGGCKGWRTRKPQGRGGSFWGVGDEAALETLHWGGGWVAFRDQWKGECRKVIGVNAIHDITTRMA